MFFWLPDRCWDLRVSTEALDYIRRGLSPYTASIDHQISEQALGHHVFVYWYPPVIVDVLRLLNYVPALLRDVLFWGIYALGFGMQLWAASRLVLHSEWKVVRYLLPLAVFFPGCLPSDTILSGNLAIPMLGAVMFTGVRGLESNRWRWFFVAVIACSLIKPPMLIWLVLPLFMDTDQRLPSIFAAFGGVAFFGIQRFIYPQRFAEFLQTVRYAMPSESNYSMGAMLARLLALFVRPTPWITLASYLVSAAVVLVVLIYFGHKHRTGHLGTLAFGTVLLLGIALLSPRLKEYDLLPLTIPACLVILRSFGLRFAKFVLPAAAAIAVIMLIVGWDNSASATILVAVFASGCWKLLQDCRTAQVPAPAEVEEPELVEASVD